MIINCTYYKKRNYKGINQTMTLYNECVSEPTYTKLPTILICPVCLSSIIKLLNTEGYDKKFSTSRNPRNTQAVL
jgi:hypothetical protein